MELAHNWVIIDITEAEAEKVAAWEIYSVVAGSIIFDDLENQTKAKKSECCNKIYEKYSQTDQVNTLSFGTEEEREAMAWFIKDMTTEFEDNQEKANYQPIIDQYFPEE